MRRVRLLALGVILFASAVALGSLALPLPRENNWLAFHAYMGIAASIAVVYVGASVVSFKGFAGFTPRLKRAYGILCVGFSLLGLAFVQLPLVIYGGTLETIFRDTQITAIAFFVSLLTIFGGTRSFAKLFVIKNITTAWWFALIPPLVLALIYSQLPHAPISTPEVEFDAGNGFNIFSMWVTALALSHILQIKRIASVQYANALAWVALTFIVMLVAVIAHLSLVLPLSAEEWLFVGVMPLIPLLIASLCFLKAAVAFNRITTNSDENNLRVFTARNFFGRPLHTTVGAEVSSIDIVNYAANLVSDPRAIDLILDRLRVITSRIAPETSRTNLPASAQEELKQVYLDIESYLLQKETIRSFTKDSLRQKIANSLKLTGDGATFWGTLPS